LIIDQEGGTMLNLFKSGCLFLFFMIGCTTSSPVTSTETRQPSLTGYKTTEVISVATSTPTLSVTPIDSNILELEVEKICPSNPEVPFSDLGMPNNLALLTVPEKTLGGDISHPLSNDVLSYSGTNNFPSKLTEIRKGDEDGIIGLNISPGGIWMAITRWNNNKSEISLWVSTIDGQRQWKVKDITQYQDIEWVNDNEILITGSPQESEYERGVPIEDKMPLFSVNPFTLETRDLAPLPSGTTYEYHSYNVIDGHPYVLFREKKSPNIYLYDYDAAVTTRAFLWIDFSDPTAGVVVKDNGLYDVALDKDGLEFATDLTLNQITEINKYDDVMKQLYVKGKKFAPSLFTPRGKYYLAALHDDLADPNQSVSYYLYDYKANILKDYCLHVGGGFVDISPDEKFASYTFYGDKDVAGYVMILNLETGYYSIIPNSKSIGFWQKD
jgi:hypothetical protein